MNNMIITQKLVNKINSLINKGLTQGLGKPEPGRMCVEAAICYALGEEHGDSPSCVSRSVSSSKIDLNDCNWSSSKARGAGMRKLAVAQLGTKAWSYAQNSQFEYLLNDNIQATIYPYLIKYATGVYPKAKFLQKVGKYKNVANVVKISAEDIINDIDETYPNRDVWSGIEETMSLGSYFESFEVIPNASEYKQIDEKYFGDSFLKKYAAAILLTLKQMKAPGVKWL